MPPPGKWRAWYVSGGRGSGKTRTGSETLANWIRDSIDAGDDQFAGEWGIVAPWLKDARNICMQGGSGLLACLEPEYVDTYNKSEGILYLANGARVFTDGANDGGGNIQGKNLRGAWCDEVGLWAPLHWEAAWNESLAFAVRLDPARIVVTGTPKQGHPLVKMLLKSGRHPVTRMRMVDNIANLAQSAVDELVSNYGQSRLGRQELEGEFLDDAPGALWTSALISLHRWEKTPEQPAPPDFDRVVIGVDPSGAADRDTGNAMIGIVCVGFSNWEQHAYVLEDGTIRGGPEQWAKAVRNMYYRREADLIVAEANFGGDMVRSTIQASDRNLPVKMVTASRGKAVRAEPIAMYYDQGRVHHVGVLADLEDQMTTWNPKDPKQPSPDRVDALVWALKEVFDGGQLTQYQVYSDSGTPKIRIGDLTLVGEHHIDKP